MSDEMPDSLPPGEPPPKQGLSTAWIVVLVILGVILLLFGVCLVGLAMSTGA
ncbi:MAG TPA: hypothetical protein VF143_06760 [Candidatus Nanopelagicales bacterium]